MCVQDGQHGFRLGRNVARAIAEAQEQKVEHADRDRHPFEVLELRLSGPFEKILDLVNERFEALVGAGVQGRNDQHNPLCPGKPFVELLGLLGMRIGLSAQFAAGKGGLARSIADVNGELAIFKGARSVRIAARRQIEFKIKPDIGDTFGRVRQIAVVTAK